MIYCIDTSAFIDAFNRLYPKDVFTTLWDKVGDAAVDGTVLAPDDVLTELSKKLDDLYKWAKLQAKLFYPLDKNLQLAVRQIANRFPDFVNPPSGVVGADPFVVGLAELKSGIVVSHEKPRNNALKIPYVCAQLGIECIDFLEFIRRQGWTFK